MPPLPPAPPAPRRVLLGPADVADDELAAFAAAALGVRRATVLTSSATVFPYDRPAITTAGRYLVTGSARTCDGEVRAFGFFVKVIHAYQQSPLRSMVPAHLRAQAAALIPWRTEADLYRSDLRDRLPVGLTIPRAAAVRDLDADSAALWLEQVPARRVAWDAGRHARAAYLLGRLAASRAVAPLATAVHGARNPRVYADTWLAHVVLPALTGNDIWAHPLVRDAFDARLRRRLLAAADALPALLGELDDAPAATAHGDACTANLLLAGDRDALVMVDLGFCGQAPLGTDLGQLIAGEVQTGQRHPAGLPGLEAACLPAYLAGVHAEGGTAGLAQVRRTHAALPMNPANILHAGGHLSGVVDWNIPFDGAGQGDRGFDIATLLFYTYDIEQTRDVLWDRALELSGLAWTTVYLCHLSLRQRNGRGGTALAAPTTHVSWPSPKPCCTTARRKARNQTGPGASQLHVQATSDCLHGIRPGEPDPEWRMPPPDCS
jgi:hypothetical protein